MYAIINTHHDDAAFPITVTDSAVARNKLAVLWTQIANHFKDYSDYLIFETMNEPKGAVNQWNGGNDEQRGIINAYHLAAVTAIRATGGNNAKRFIMCCTHSACPLDVAINGLVIPNNDTNVLVSLHTYYPQNFSLDRNPATWGSSTDSANVRAELTRELAAVASKGNTAVIGEWGSETGDELASRVRHACYYAQQVRLKGMVPVWWDDGGTGATGFGLLHRTANPVTWYYPTIAQALCNCASSVVVAIEPVQSKENILLLDGLYGLMERAGTIHFSLTSASFVSLQVYTLQGRIAATLIKSMQPAGHHEVKLPAKGISSGIYVLTLKVGENSATKNLAIF